MNYELNREYNKNGTSGFICGRVTMESSFTGGWYPDLTKYEPTENKPDFTPDNLSGFYAVSFDPKGKLEWENNTIKVKEAKLQPMPFASVALVYMGNPREM